MAFDEQSYEQGSLMAWRLMLGQCLRHLGIDDAEAGKVRWVAERTDVVLMLRQVCEEYGDQDWDDDLHLGDVIEKHLWEHLPELGGEGEWEED